MLDAESSPRVYDVYEGIAPPAGYDDVVEVVHASFLMGKLP